MKKFRVYAMGREELAEQIIEAKTAEEAQEKYYDVWTAGKIETCDYELGYTTTEVDEGAGEDDE